MSLRIISFATIIMILAVILTGCGTNDKISSAGSAAKLGSVENPIKVALVPSLDTKKLMASGEKLSQLLEKETGLKYKISVPTSYTTVITAMGANNVDVGFLSPLPYVLAHDQYGVKVVLVTVRDNSIKYHAAIITRTDSGINKLIDLKGKRFAYGDPVSTSGCIYPKHLIRTNGYDPEKFFSNVIFAGAHDKVVMAVYNKQADAGAIYAGATTDAREKVEDALPDVFKKTKVIANSIDIPNDTVSIRKGLPADIEKKVTQGLINVAKSDEGKLAVMKLYGIDGFVPTKDSDYDSVRKVAKAESISLKQLDKK